ncbi:MAG: hypothetical protein AMXMBFR66_30030 [Pseudomonadota bacterium]|nr:formate dehydrogenase [Rubrivivax sp.]
MSRKSVADPISAPPAPLSRRALFAGAGGVGALAAAAALLPGAGATPPAPAAPAAAEGQEGYRLTEHVRRYYRTARV